MKFIGYTPPEKDDITAIVAGTGLAGGGVSGDLTLAISSGFQDVIDANSNKATNVSTNLSIANGAGARTIASSDGTNAVIPVATTSVSGVMSVELVEEVIANTAKDTNVVTNLAISGSTSARTITSSDGTNAVIPIATTSVSGLINPDIFDEITANNAKATNVTTNLSVTTGTTTARINSSDGSTTAVIPIATTSVGGLMSAAIFDEHTVNNNKNTNVVGNLTAEATGTALNLVTSNGSNVALPAATNERWGIMSDDLVTALEANTAKNTNVVTNLSVASSTGSRIIASSDGTNATIPVATTSASGVMSPSAVNAVIANNAKNTSSNVYGDYIRLLPSDFATNSDGGNTKQGVAYVNTAGTSYGMKVPSADTELFAFVSIPEGMKATDVEIFGKRTRGIEVFEVQINATTMTSKGTGNCNTELSITNVDATATNLLAIYVDIASTSADRVYGGRVKIAAQ